MTYEIRAATLADIRALVRTARPLDRAEVEGWGLCWKHTLHALYRDSATKRVALVDGEVAAIWGVQGPVMSDDAAPWLFTTPAVERAKLAFFRETKREIEAMLVTHRRLRAYVLASYEQSLRFFHAMGFSFGDPEPVGINGTAYRLMTLERPVISEGPPVCIFTLPRSRSAWLSVFLSFGNWACSHDASVRMRGMDDVQRFFSRPNAITVETGIAPGWRLLARRFPEMRMVVVRRSIEEVIASWSRAFGDIPFDSDKMRRVVVYMDRMLDQIARQPGVRSVAFSDLSDQETCRALFEHCLPYRMPDQHFNALKDRNIQVSFRDIMTYRAAHHAEIDAFKRAARAELRQLVRAVA
jgi:hypothetical protein